MLNRSILLNKGNLVAAVENLSIEELSQPVVKPSVGDTIWFHGDKEYINKHLIKHVDDQTQPTVSKIEVIVDGEEKDGLLPCRVEITFEQERDFIEIKLG